MDDHFERAVTYVLENEGGFVNDPMDVGGATNFGITMAALAAWRKTGVTAADVQALTIEEAKQIYHVQYWEPLALSEAVPLPVAIAILDTAVNQGVGTATLHVERAMQTFRTRTLAAIAPNLFLSKFIPIVQNHYVSIAVSNPFQVKFLRGWLARSQRLLGLMA